MKKLQTAVAIAALTFSVQAAAMAGGWIPRWLYVIYTSTFD